MKYPYHIEKLVKGPNKKPKHNSTAVDVRVSDILLESPNHPTCTKSIIEGNKLHIECDTMSFARVNNSSLVITTITSTVYESALYLLAFAFSNRIPLRIKNKVYYLLSPPANIHHWRIEVAVYYCSKKSTEKDCIAKFQTLLKNKLTK